MSEESVEEEKREEAEEVAEVAEELAEEVEKPKKRVREKVAKRVRKPRKVSSYYKVGEEGVERLRPFCERCGPGFFMADHGDRLACGHCGFTRYKRGGVA